MRILSSVFLRQPVLSSLIEVVAGGFDELPVIWNEKHEETNGNFPKPRNRATLYRWMQDGVPTKGGDSEYQLLALCGLLDVDPLAIFDYEKNGYFSNFANLRRLLQFGRQALGLHDPLFEMFCPGEYWPSDELAKKFYGRPWFSKTFVNEVHWESSNYVLVDASFKQMSSAPRAIHIAYRRHKTSDTMWRFYGTVISLGGKLELYNEGGDHRAMPSPGQGKICFRTYFGGRPVEFRIASLHDFDHSLTYPFNDKSVIGFEW
jgi:hypothetical protein